MWVNASSPAPVRNLNRNASFHYGLRLLSLENLSCRPPAVTAENASAAEELNGEFRLRSDPSTGCLAAGRPCCGSACYGGTGWRANQDQDLQTHESFK